MNLPSAEPWVPDSTLVSAVMTQLRPSLSAMEAFKRILASVPRPAAQPEMNLPPDAGVQPSDAELDALIADFGPTQGLYEDSRDLSMNKLRALIRCAVACFGTRPAAGEGDYEREVRKALAAKDKWAEFIPELRGGVSAENAIEILGFMIAGEKEPRQSGSAGEADEDIQRARNLLARLCERGLVSMSIPVDHSRDEDMLLSRIIERAALSRQAPAAPAADTAIDDASFALAQTMGERAAPTPEAKAREILEICRGWSQSTFGWQGNDPDGFAKARKAHDDECVRRIVASLSTPPTPEAEQDTHTTSGRSADELWAETGRLRAKLADVNAQQDKSAPWLTQAHMLCKDHGIPQGHIEWRLEVLRGLLGKQAAEAEPVQQDTKPLTKAEFYDVARAAMRVYRDRNPPRYLNDEQASASDSEFIGELAECHEAATPPAEKQAAPSGEDNHG